MRAAYLPHCLALFVICGCESSPVRGRWVGETSRTTLYTEHGKAFDVATIQLDGGTPLSGMPSMAAFEPSVLADSGGHAMPADNLIAGKRVAVEGAVTVRAVRVKNSAEALHHAGYIRVGPDEVADEMLQVRLSAPMHEADETAPTADEVRRWHRASSLPPDKN